MVYRSPCRDSRAIPVSGRTGQNQAAPTTRARWSGKRDRIAR